MSGIALNIQPFTPQDYVRSVQRQTQKLRAALTNDASPQNTLTMLPLPANESRFTALADALAIVEKTKASVALVPPETLSRPDILEGNGSFAKPEVPSQGSDDDDEQLNFTDSESAPMSESEDETDDDVPSIKNMNDPIYKETITYPTSTSSASTIRTMPSTPLALPLGSEVGKHMIALEQHSPSFPTIAVLLRQGPRDEIDPSRRSPGTSAIEKGEHHHRQTEDAGEVPSSQRGKYEPGSAAGLPRRTRPYGIGSQNDPACIDGIGKTTHDYDRYSYSGSGSDNEGGNNGDDDEYSDDGSCSDSSGEDDDYSKKRTDDSSSASRPPDRDIVEKPASTRKRQKVAHDEADMPLPRVNSGLHSAERLSRSPERPLTTGMPSPPTSHGLSVTESDAGSVRSEASEASFWELPLHNAALKCVTIDGVTTYHLQFQQPPMHSCRRRERRRPDTLVKNSKGGPKPRDVTKGRRRCGVCKQAGHNARTCLR